MLNATAIKNFSTAGKNTHAVGCCLQGNYFESLLSGENCVKVV
jgi:hypothetical protein